MTSVNYTPNRQAFLDIVVESFPGAVTITRKQIVELVRVKYAGEIKWPSWLTGDKSLRAGRGEFTIPTLVKRTDVKDEAVEAASDSETVTSA